MASTKGYAPIVVTHERGLRFAAQVRSHRVIVDQPPPSGEDSAPMPIEMLGVSLGTCVALYVQLFLQARGVPATDMRVEVATEGASHPNRIGLFSVRIVLPAGVPDEYREMLERVAQSCPAHATLAHGAEVRFSIDAGTLASV
jgi:uncharacterized OsmC-like protein